MASYPALDEKANLAQSFTDEEALLDTSARSRPNVHTHIRRQVLHQRSFLSHLGHGALTAVVVLGWCLLAFGVFSALVGAAFTWRPASSCSSVQPGARGMAHAHEMHVPVPGGAPLTPEEDYVNALAAVEADAEAEAIKAGPMPEDATVTPSSAFTRLLEVVSPESLHQLLHHYFPSTYKHGVYPSEKSALEAIHRTNAALATSIARRARRDVVAAAAAANSTVPATTATSTLTTASDSAAPSDLTTTTTGTTSLPSTPATTTTPAVASSTPVAVSSAAAATTTTSDGQTTSKTAAASTTATTTTKGKHTTTPTTTAATTDKKTAGVTGKSTRTSIYTSTINGTPTIITATSVVGVGVADATSSGTSTSVEGSLQTGAAAALWVPGASGSMRLAEAVAGLVVGALLV